MTSDVLLDSGLSIEMLNELSYKTSLGKSLKNNLHCFDKEKLIEELYSMSDWYDEQDLLYGVNLDYRVKSYESILNKYNRHSQNEQVRKVFNDILGFRTLCSDYTEILALKDKYKEVFHIADLSRGKAMDDGYRGVHLYYQADNYHYRIEIQFNTYRDRPLNDWLHDNVYKKGYPNTLGQSLREKYDNALIKDFNDFEEAMKNVLSGS